MANRGPTNNVGIARDYLRAAALVLVGCGPIFLLSACGGGGGGSSSSPSVAPSGNSPDPVTDGNSDPETIDAGGTSRLTLAWTSTATNADGSCSDGIRGYRINLGLLSGLYDYSAVVNTAQVHCSTLTADECGEVRRCRYTVERLTRASWYVTLQSVDINGRQSRHSEEIVAAVY